MNRQSSGTQGSGSVLLHGTGRLSAAIGTAPPTLLVLLAVVSVQLGSAIAKDLFAQVGPGGAVLLRIGFGAAVLLTVRRPRITGHTRRDYLMAALFGLAVAAMNLSFYLALNRIPLGIAVTLEFVGPLGVAIAGSRRVLDVVWVVLAAAGIALLAPWGGLHLDPGGVLLALLAGSLWAAYILLSARVGRAFPDGAGLLLALIVGTVVLTPVGVSSAGASLLHPQVLVVGAAVGVFSAVVPYSLEMEALRRLPTQIFGVLMSAEPAVAALMGFIILHQALQARALAAILLVTVASVGAARFAPRVPID